MAHGNLAQSAALVGAVGSVLVLLAREKWAITGGFLALLLAEAGLVLALVPRHDLDRLTTPLAPRRRRRRAFWSFSRAPTPSSAIRPVVPGRAARRGAVPAPREPGGAARVPARAAVCRPRVGLARARRACLQGDCPRAAARPRRCRGRVRRARRRSRSSGRSTSRREARSSRSSSSRSRRCSPSSRGPPFASWLPRALAVAVVGLAAVFAAIGLWQEKTHRIFFAHDLRVANTYTSVLPGDLGLQGPEHLRAPSRPRDQRAARAPVARQGAVPRRGADRRSASSPGSTSRTRSRAWPCCSRWRFLITVAVGDRMSRRIVVVAAIVGILAAGAIAGRALSHHSLRHATSGRSRLISVTARVIRNHPLVGRRRRLAAAREPQRGEDEGRRRARTRRIRRR